MQVRIYGKSDDLLEIEFNGNDTAEFNPPISDTNYLAFSDGTMLRVIYDDDGVWRINPWIYGSATYHKIEATAGEASDIVTLNGDIDWVVVGKEWARA